jgi:hypothetical protein
MELEELKSLWRKNEPSFPLKNEQEIALMLRGKSTSIIEKLKRSVWFELVVANIVSVGLLIYAISLESGALKKTSIALLLMCLAYTAYYIKKLILLNRFKPGNENLHDAVSQLVRNLTSYLKFYRNSYAILYPFYFALGLLFGALERGPEQYLEFLSRPSVIVSLLVLAGIFFVVSIWIGDWYLKKLYGNHLDKLKNVLTELGG